MNHGCSASKSLNHRSVFQIVHLTICISFLVPQFSKFSKRWTMFNGVIILRTKTGKFNGPNELPKCSRDSNDSAVISKEFKSAHKILIVWYFELLSMEFVSIFWSFSNGKDDSFFREPDDIRRSNIHLMIVDQFDVICWMNLFSPLVEWNHCFDKFNIIRRTFAVRNILRTVWQYA